MLEALQYASATVQSLFASRPELAVFAAIAIGYAIGSIRLGPFQLGGVAGTLLAALAIGQLGVHIDPGLQRFMFTLFIYALGFSVAPQFFSSIDRSTWSWSLLVVIEVALIVAVALAATWLLNLDVGTASGLLAGSATESAMLGTATEAIARLSLSATAITALQGNVATAYALSYIFSLITIVLFTSQIAPALLRIDLRKEARDALARLGGHQLDLDADQRVAFSALVSRAFSVTVAAGKTVAAVEAEHRGAVAIEEVRRGGATIPVSQDLMLLQGDEVALSGLRTALAGSTLSIGPELSDPTDLRFIVETRDVVFIRAVMRKPSVKGVLEFLRGSGCHGVFLAGITRMEREVPPLIDSRLLRGDVLRLFGKPEDVSRAASLLGTAQAPSNVTDFVYLGVGLLVGVLVGMITLPMGTVSVSLGSAGALLSGLGFGWLRSRRPTFGRFPAAASQILKDLGLAVFIAAIGLTSAPSVLKLLETRGWELPIAAILISSIPPLASVYVGRYLLHMEPAILCGAIAGQHASTPAINATEAAAGNTVPVIGYTVTYAIANVVLPILSPLFVALFVATHSG